MSGFSDPCTDMLKLRPSVMTPRDTVIMIMNRMMAISGNSSAQAVPRGCVWVSTASKLATVSHCSSLSWCNPCFYFGSYKSNPKEEATIETIIVTIDPRTLNPTTPKQRTTRRRWTRKPLKRHEIGDDRSGGFRTSGTLIKYPK